MKDEKKIQWIEYIVRGAPVCCESGMLCFCISPKYNSIIPADSCTS